MDNYFDNKQLTDAFKRLDLSAKRTLVFDYVGTLSESITRLKTFGKKGYITFVEDGKNKLLVARSYHYLYNYFLDFSFGAVEVLGNDVLIEFDYSRNNIIEEAYFVCGENMQKLDIKENKLTGSLLELREDLLLTKPVELAIIFRNEISEEPLNVRFLIPVKENFINSLTDDILLISKKERLNLVPLYENKVNILVEEVIPQGKIIVEVIGLTDQKSKIAPGGEFMGGYWLLDISGIRYIVSAPNNSSTFDNAVARVENRYTQRKDFAKKISLPILRAAYNILGYDRYNKLQLWADRTLRDTPYKFYTRNKDLIEVLENRVLIESFHGTRFAGNMFYIAKELSDNYNYEIAIVAIESQKQEVQRKLDKYGIQAKIVQRNSKEYFTRICSSKYLINDSTWATHVTPKLGQVFVNSWHGTPLKTMGKKIKNSPFALSNTQRNFFMTDYLIVSNQFTKDIFEEDYMLSNLKSQDVYVGPSPRTSHLVTPSGAKQSEKIRVVWMPTWRGEGNDATGSKNIALYKRMDAIARSLPDNYEFFVNPHQMILASIDMDDFKMQVVPEEFEIYDFLKTSDILITDYSSIMFDYAIMNKKIVLDIYDMDEYLADRGVYLNIEELPFALARNDVELLEKIVEEHEVNYEEFNKLYNPHDNPNGAHDFVEMFLSGEERLRKIEKKNVLIFPGPLTPNGITTSALNLLANIKDDRYNFVLYLPMNLVRGYNDRLDDALNTGFDYIPSPPRIVLNDPEKLIYRKFVSRLSLSLQEKAILNQAFKKEVRRIFSGLTFSDVIHFTGYDANPSKILENMNARRHMWVHNNLNEELLIKNNLNRDVLFDMYSAATTIDVVNHEVCDELLATSYFADDVRGKVGVVRNTIDFKGILEKSQEDVEYITDDVREILEDPDNIKFINIARFSPEKGLDRLVKAFNTVSANNPDKRLYLFLIGGNGVEKNNIINLIESSDFKDNIYLYENVNPLPLLKKADLFVLSSYYEGLPMVFFESLTLNVPILSTNIPGPRDFLGQGYGNICKNSTEGIAEGMQEYLEGKLNLDIKSLKEFNDKALEEFYNILNKN